MNINEQENILNKRFTLTLNEKIFLLYLILLIRELFDIDGFRNLF